MQQGGRHPILVPLNVWRLPCFSYPCRFFVLLGFERRTYISLDTCGHISHVMCVGFWYDMDAVLHSKRIMINSDHISIVFRHAFCFRFGEDGSRRKPSPPGVHVSAAGSTHGGGRKRPDCRAACPFVARERWSILFAGGRVLFVSLLSISFSQDVKVSLLI